jgi:dGTPase
MMNWNQLLAFKRLGDAREHPYDPARPPWQFDYDRIIFSSAFRRMQDKTQVFPLSGSDYVRTRLTHSLEVSTVAKSLGTAAGQTILQRWGHLQYQNTGKTIRELLSPSDIGMIVATGALAHDIGNPPFGHSGENAIRYWFKNSPVAQKIKRTFTEQQKADFENWEGNAEGFRILARQQMARDSGGLRLTYAALGAYAKYPTASTAMLDKDEAKNRIHAKKTGFFENDNDLWSEAATALGLIREDEFRWCRHPLAYLTEAADDICYRIIDLEDGLRLARLGFSEVEDLYLEAVGELKADWRNQFLDWDDQGRITYLRARVFSIAVRELVAVFIANEESLLCGDFKGDLLSRTPSAEVFGKMKSLAVKKVYSMRGVLEIEAAGFEIIPGLLDVFADAVEKVAVESSSIGECLKARKLLNLIPREFRGSSLDADVHPNPYIRLLGVVDFVAGMTDSFALSLYRKIKGIALPS